MRKGRTTTQPNLPGTPELFQLAFERAPIGMGLVSPDGRYLKVNAALCRFFDRTEAELLQSGWQELTHPEDVSLGAAEVSDLLAGRIRQLQLRKRYLRRDGTVVWGDLAVCAFGAPGFPECTIAQVVDVTSEVAADTARQELERRYRLLAENASDVVYLRGLDGVIQWISPSSQTVLGYQPDEVVGTDPAALVVNRTPQEMARFRAELPTDGTSVSYLSTVRAADGSLRHMSSMTRAVLDDERRPVGFVVAMRDVGDLIAAQELVEADRERLRATMDSMLDPMVILEPVRDATGRIHDFCHIGANQAAARHTNRTVSELVGRDLSDIVPGQADSGLFAHYAAVIETGQPMILDAVPYADEQQGGIMRSFDMRGVKVGDNAVCVTFRDVTERQEAAAALAASEALFRAAMQSAPIGMALTDLRGQFELCNSALERMLQRPTEWFKHHPVADSVVPEDLAQVGRAGQDLLAGELESYVGPVRLLRADGSIATTRTAVVLLGGEPRHFLLQVVDLTGEVEAREELAYRALHDRLTGLRNREWVMDVLQLDLQAAARTGERLGVCFIDLDNFKLVNDSLGHAAGDEVLKVVAGRISDVLPTGAQVGRFGGDEFIVIVPGPGSPTDVERFAEQLSEAISMPLSVHGHPILPTASIGIAFSQPDSTAESLLRDTDAAVNRAKESGRARWHFFDEDMHATALRRLTVEGELRRGLRNSEFVAFYQPIVALADGTITAHEALVRWMHPQRGLLGPGEFLAVAEESGLIVPIGLAVLEQACEILAENPRLPGSISVNFSGGQLAGRNWLDNVMAVLGNVGVDPRRLVIEVTETAVLSLRESTRRDLTRLRDLGIGIHVDDFGTGYSSISLLRDIPVTGLKLDGSFVADLTTRPSPANALAAGLAGLANGLNLVRIAEGVETWAQATLLSSQGWTYGQGYLFARPGPTTRSGVIEPALVAEGGGGI